MTISSKTFLIAVTLALTSLGAQAQTQAPANAPAGTTVQCKDGSYASPATRSGACRGHHGIQTWYGPSAAASPAAATPAPSAPAPAPSSVARTAPGVAATAAGAAPAAAAPAAAKSAGNQALANMPVAPGGGPGKVWVNESSKVYHCADDRYYGKTHNGAYMSETDAKAQGAHPAHNKACS